VVKKTAPFAPLHINSASKYIIDGLTKNLPRWEEQGWIGVENKEFFKPTVSHLHQRGATTTFKWTKGHPSLPGNVGADDLALQGALKTTFDVIDLSIDEKFDLTGAQLSGMSQAMAYQCIQELKTQTQ